MPERLGREGARPVRYVLYSHWAVGSKEEDITRGDSERPFRYLEQARSDLSKLLDDTAGLLVLFFDPGWRLALQQPRTSSEEEQLTHAKLYASEFKGLVRGAFEQRVRVLTAEVLPDYIEQLHRRQRPEIYRWFVGEKGVATYDSPKIVEAFLRVRLLGGLPVLRVDWDVLVNIGETGEFEQLGISPEAIHASLDRNDEEEMDVFTRTWVSSAGYETPREDTYECWSRGFATRIQPALLATPKMCQLVCGAQSGLLKKDAETPEPDEETEAIVERSFRVELAERYLGVSRAQNGTWTVRPGVNIASLGANPLQAVISGALLNLSASAIMDLPPFSNMTRGVMWIDDHLKFELHNSLKHLRPDARVDCRLSKSVVKGRSAPQSNLAAYTWGGYLPTLLLGLVMDAWIRRVDENDPLPPLAEALNKAVTTGDFTYRTALKLEKRLREVAIDRIREVHEAWSKLRSGETHTLASAWATSEVADLLGMDRVNPESRGLGLIKTGRKRIDAISDLREPIQDELRELIWDAIDYILLTLAWPGMIQTIRAVRKSLLPLRED